MSRSPPARQSAEAPAATEQEVPGARVTEATLSTLVTYLTFLAELAGALVIAVAVVRGLLRYVPHIFRRTRADDTYTEDIRLQVGKSLALALEFELGADILKTAVAPTLVIIAQLAAIASCGPSLTISWSVSCGRQNSAANGNRWRERVWKTHEVRASPPLSPKAWFITVIFRLTLRRQGFSRSEAGQPAKAQYGSVKELTVPCRDPRSQAFTRKRVPGLGCDGTA